MTHGSASVVIAYDNADRRTSLTLPNGIVAEYTYDDDSRLTATTYEDGGTPIGDLTYTYDLAGQQTSVGGTWARTNLPAALASAAYDDANQIATFGGVSFSYDANGNLTNDGTRTYTWDARNQLASLTAPVNGSFAYDGVGRRRAKTIGGHRFTGEIQVRVVGRSGKRRHRRACRHRLEIHGDVDVRRDGHLK